jgi:hypothetical protein
MRTPEGQTYGPVSREELDRWVVQGRLAADCQLSESATGPWESAAIMFPALARPAVQPPPDAPAFQPAFPFGGAPGPGVPGRYVVPHRGGLILVLAILGVAMGCPIFSLMAWVMGSGDIREMQSGRMDPSGEGLTQAGRLLGMILSLMWILGGMFIVFIIFLAALAGN